MMYLKSLEDRLILLTAHRRENHGEPMRNMFRAVKRLVEENSNIQVVYPVHLNPVVREVASDILGNDPRIHLIEPLDVIDFHNFAERAHLILTDSGEFKRKHHHWVFQFLFYAIQLSVLKALKQER